MSDIKFGIKISIIATVVLYTLWFFIPVYEPAFKPEQVACFPMPSIAGRFPAVKPMLPESAEAEADRHRYSMQSYHTSLREAEFQCTPQACETPGLKKYRSQLRQYILTRENITRNLYRDRGDQGLATAQSIFDTPVDEAIIDHLRALLKAGRIDLATLREAKQSAALLALKPASAYVPCADETPRAAESNPNSANKG